MDPFIESHLEWIKTFDCSQNIDDLNKLSDGIIIAKILRQISSSYFTKDWFDKLKQNPENWRLRVSNLKKIFDKLIDYYDNVLLISPNIELPDLNKIGREESQDDLARLLQLILGIAVSCDHKQMYIEKITKLNLSIQQNLMEAIQQLMNNNMYEKKNSTLSNECLNNNTNTFLDSLNNDDTNYHKEIKDQLIKTIETLRITNEKKEAILQQNHELSKKLLNEQNEKVSLQNEYEKLLEKYNKIKSKEGDSDFDENTEILKNKSITKLKNRIEQLEKELILSENQREENLIKLDLIQKEMVQLRVCNEDLQRKAKETQFLQDELDVHRHSSDKMLKYEQKLDVYKKKIEEFVDLKKEYKVLEEKNIQLVSKNLELEEELKKPSIFKQQIQDYKKQIQELHQVIIEKNCKADRLEFDLEKQIEKFNYLIQEKSNLEREKEELKSKLNNHDSMKDELDSFNPLAKNDIKQDRLIKNCLDFEINDFSNDLKEKLTRIELENKLLKNRLEETNQEAVLLLRTSYEDAKARVNELEKDNRKLNKSIIELESKLKNISETKSDNYSENNSSVKLNNKVKELEDQLRNKLKTIDMNNNQIYDLEQKITNLQGELTKKDDEFNEMDAKYKQYVSKAKQAVNMLEPISLHLNSLSSTSMSPSNSSMNSICNNGNFVNNLNDINKINQSNALLSVHNTKTPTKINSQNDEIYNTNNIETLKKALIEKDKKINELIIEHERERNLSEMETRLITVAFHNLSFNLSRKSATERIFQNSTSSHQINQVEFNTPIAQESVKGSLLFKQRQSAARRLKNLNY